MLFVVIFRVVNSCSPHSGNFPPELSTCDVICINYLDIFTYFWTLRMGKSVNTHTVFLVYTKLAFIPKTQEITVPAWGKVELTSETSF